MDSANIARDASSPSSFWQHQQGSLPELMYSLSALSDLYELGLGATKELEIQELRQHILKLLCRTVQAQDACFLLYNEAQQYFVTVATQGTKIPCGLLASSINTREMFQLATRGPGETLATLQLKEHSLLLVTLSYNRSLLGIVALTIADGAILQDERGLLLSAMGNVAGLLLHNYALRSLERCEAIEQERKRIARDLHDGVVQNLGYLLHTFEFTLHLLEQKEIQQAIAEIEHARRILEGSLYELHHSLYSSLPLQLTTQVLTDALVTLLHDYITRHPETEITTTIDEAQQIPGRLETPLFRFVQEALSNIEKHAQATHIVVNICRSEEMLVVEVSDNGIGMPVSEGVRNSKAGGVGLWAMRERIEAAGGIWEIQSQAGKGTTVRAQFLLAHPRT